jgi:hypothetical protein
MNDVTAVIDLIIAFAPSSGEGDSLSAAEKRNAWTTPGLELPWHNSTESVQ